MYEKILFFVVCKKSLFCAVKKFSHEKMPTYQWLQAADNLCVCDYINSIDLKLPHIDIHIQICQT